MKDSAQPTGRKAPGVLLAVSQSERREQLRELILGRAPGTRVEMVCNALDALMPLARKSTDSATEVLLWSEAPECLQHWIDTWTSARSMEESQQ